jgi:hypothetical protein
MLARDVVVVAVDGHAAERERRDALGVGERLQGRLHHQLAVLAGEVLGPLDRLDVVAEVLGALRQIREVLVGQVDHPALHLPLGEGDEVRADAVTDPARARVQHDPHLLALVEADLDEVVAGAERAEVHDRVRLLDRRVLRGDAVEAGLEARPDRADRLRRLVPRALVAAVVDGAAVRHGALDRRAQRREVVGQVAGLEAGLDRHHAAADVDADRRGDDRAHGRDDAADRRAHAPVHVGHRGDPAVDEGHARDVLELAQRRVLDRHAAGPALDRHAAVGLVDLVSKVFKAGHGAFLSSFDGDKSSLDAEL